MTIYVTWWAVCFFSLLFLVICVFYDVEIIIKIAVCSGLGCLCIIPYSIPLRMFCTYMYNSILLYVNQWHEADLNPHRCGPVSGVVRIIGEWYMVRSLVRVLVHLNSPCFRRLVVRSLVRMIRVLVTALIPP